jgi:methionine synthase I (cobalamin-dependent)
MDRLAEPQGVTTFDTPTNGRGADKIVCATRSGMQNFKEIEQALRELMGQRVLVLDGAMGTMLQQRDLSAQDFGGAALEGCNEVLVRTRPDVVLDIHRKYFAAGADIVETDTFGGTPLVLGEYGLSAEALELNKKAAELARQAAGEFAKPGRPRGTTECFCAGR